MKLTIKRGQADVKGMFGGHKGVEFSLFCQAEVTPDEAALIERYRVGDYVLASYEIHHKDKTLEVDYTVANILRGTSTNLGSITSLLELEGKIKKACSELKMLLWVMSTFGGEEVVEI